MTNLITNDKLYIFHEHLFDHSLISLYEHTYKSYGSPSYRNSAAIIFPIKFQDVMLDKANSYINKEGKFTSSDLTKHFSYLLMHWYFLW